MKRWVQYGKVLKGIKNSFEKIGTAYKKFSEKDARIDTIITISGVMLFAFLVMFTCQKIMGANAVSIATNKAEASFFEGEYDAAIAEYQKLQEDDEWPIYTTKIAEIYSVKGDYVDQTLYWNNHIKREMSLLMRMVRVNIMM